MVVCLVFSCDKTVLYCKKRECHEIFFIYKVESVFSICTVTALTILNFICYFKQDRERISKGAQNGHI